MKKIFLFLFFNLLILQKINASDGTLEIQTNSPIGQAEAVAIQTDGKIIAAGFDTGPVFKIARYNTAVGLDLSTSGPAGKAFGVIIQPDSKIVAAGIDNSGNIQVVRYNPDLTQDIIFQTIPNSTATSIVIQTDQKTVIAGQDTTSGKALVARYNTDGTLDSTFGTNGVTLLDTPLAPLASANDLILQPDEKILIAGTSSGGNFLIARFNTDGSLDTTFGLGAGFVETPSGSANAISIQPDNKILAAGTGPIPDTFQVIRYTNQGDLDITFNGTGIYIDSNGNNAFDLNIQADGKIIVYGGSLIGDFLLARLTTSGTLDTTFGISGYTTTLDFIGARVGALQLDGKIIAVGSTKPVPVNSFEIVRYFNSVPLTPTTITSPTNNAIIISNSGTATFSGIAQNPSNIYIYLNNSFIGGTVTDPAGSNTWEFTKTGLTAGTYTLQVISIYKDGRINLASDIINFTVSQIPIPPIPPIPVNPTIIPTSASAIVSAIISKYCLFRIGVSS